jgi:hypothetical protein
MARPDDDHRQSVEGTGTMTKYIITLSNAGGELDCRVVERKEEIRAAVLDVIGGCAEMLPGDAIEVSEVEE